MQMLIAPKTYEVAAELMPDQYVTIHDKTMQKELVASGIGVSREFMDKYQVSSTVYPTDESRIFAKAFEQFYFVHGLQQQGFYWVDKNVWEKRSEELDKHIAAIQALKPDQNDD